MSTVLSESGRVNGSPVRFEGLGKRYGTFVAVHPTDLQVGAGEFLSFLGPSGSGKTTTLMMLAGFEAPTSGRIMVGERDVTNIAPARRDIGMVFQSYALFPHMTVAQNIAFPLRMRRMASAERDRQVARVLEIVGLGEFAARYPAQLSGGQQQRVALARAIVFQPPVLLMDEPLSALDKYLRSHLQSEIKRIQRELGITVVYVTHDQDEAMTMSDRICVMRDGRIAQIGRPEDLYRAPEDEFVAGFLGESNMFERRAEAAGAGAVRVDLDGGLVIPARRALTADRVRISLRPEHLRFHADAAGSATVRDATYVGDHRRYELVLDDGTQLVAKVQVTDGSGALAAGTRVAIDWPVAEMRLFAEGKALQ